MKTYAAVLTMALSAALASSALAQSTPKMVKVDMKTATGQEAGTVTLKQHKGGVEVKIDLMNLPAGDHAIHIHEHAMCDGPDFKTAGGHFNPDGKHHGYENPDGHHAGDVPFNLTVGADGMAKKSFYDANVTLNPSAPNSVFANGGTAIIVHAKADDMKSDPSGNAGARIACGTITMPSSM